MEKEGICSISFIVRENKKGVRTVIRNTDSVFKVFFSSLKGKILCASSSKKEFVTSCQEYFSIDKSAIKGSLKVVFTINDPIAYAAERNTEKILDAILRTILSEYFSGINLENKKAYFQMTEDDAATFVNLANIYTSNILPYIKLESIGRVLVSNNKNFTDRFTLKKKEELDKDENERSMDPEYYKPLNVRLADDLSSSKYEYPPHRFIACDQMLYYNGSLKGPGTYNYAKARGNIVNLGKHIYTTSKTVAKSTIERSYDNRIALCPNIVYEVNNLVTYYKNYYDVIELFEQLAEKITARLIFNPDIENTIENAISLEAISCDDINKIIDEIKEYDIDPVFILFSQKNPCVRKQENIKTEEEIFGELFKNMRPGNVRK